MLEIFEKSGLGPLGLGWEALGLGRVGELAQVADLAGIPAQVQGADLAGIPAVDLAGQWLGRCCLQKHRPRVAGWSDILIYTDP